MKTFATLQEVMEDRLLFPDISWITQIDGTYLGYEPHEIPKISDEQQLANAKSVKRDELKQAVMRAITSGVSINIFGAQHHYPTTSVDQQNLSGLIIRKLLPDASNEHYFWSADPSGVWARRKHTTDEIIHVGIMVFNHIKNCQSHYEKKLALVDAANTEEAVDVIHYD